MIDIKVKNIPSQSFNQQIEGVVFNFSIIYNARGEYFSMSVSTQGFTIKGIKLVSGIRLFQFSNAFEGDFIVVNSAEYDADPKMGTWDISTELFYLSKEEVELLL